MSNSSTYLRILNNCLSGRSKKIFPNQVVFYNAVFGVTNPLLLPDEFLEDINRISRGDRQPSDEALIKQVNYLLRSGLDSNSANVGKHINNAQELPIPKRHRAHLENHDHRDDIILRLQVIVRFCLMFQPAKFRMEEDDFRELLERMKAELSDASHALREADELSVELLGIAIYEVLRSHLSRTKEQCYPAEGDRPVRVDLTQHWKEYEARVDCYGDSSIDRFFALKRLAEDNVVAAYVLAGIYYYGGTYYASDEGEGNNGVYRVDIDKELAGRYYKKAADCEPPVMGACWTMGYLIWNHMFTNIGEDQVEELALGYFNRAMEQGYVPSYNSVGMIEIARGNRLLKKRKGLREKGEDLAREEWENLLFHYCRGVELCDRAGCSGWVYGHINVAYFLEDHRDSIWPLIRSRVKLEGSTNLRERWKAAADMGNLWARNRLALLECQAGRYREAADLWEAAAQMHYPAANLNLALYIYGPDCQWADSVKYRSHLEQASTDGSARASFELASLYLKSNPFMARMLLSRAEEQNYRKFNNKLYHQIKEMQRQLKD